MPKNKGKRGKNRKRGKNEAGDGKIKEDSIEIISPPPLSTDPSQLSPKSPPTDTGALGKICVICLGSLDLDLPIGSVDDDGDPWDMNFSLFLLDLDAECESPVRPNMCFSSFRLRVQGFCVLGPNLYLFGNEKRDVFSYPLSSIPSVPSSPPEELTEHKLGKTPPMKYGKYFPTGCQTPDGTKMVVFSTIFFVEDKRNINFELFDGENWTELPDLLPFVCDDSGSSGSLRVISYSFIDDKPDLLVSTELGNFTLNVEHPERGWSQWKDFSLPRMGYKLPMLVRGRWRLMAWYEWVDGKEPELSYPWYVDGYDMSGGHITWLSPLNRFCVLRSHIETATMLPRLTIDVCDLDDEASGPELNKRIEFVLGLPVQERSFLPLLLHSMRNKEAV